MSKRRCTSSWRNNDVIITFRVSWDGIFTERLCCSITDIEHMTRHFCQAEHHSTKHTDCHLAATHDIIITPLLRQSDVTTSFWRNHGVIITSGVHWEASMGHVAQELLSWPPVMYARKLKMSWAAVVRAMGSSRQDFLRTNTTMMHWSDWRGGVVV